MKNCFAGLGVMGAPMAGHLVAAGHQVTGYNRSFEKAETWASSIGAVAFERLSDAAKDCDVLILCVGRDADVEACVLEALPHLAKKALIIDHTTTSKTLAQAMYKICAEQGHSFYDAPVSGGQAGAVNGQLTLMVGGDAARFAEVVEITKPYTKAITRIGETGAGQLAKMANQIAIAGVVQGLAEALHFTQKAGLDTDAVFAAISQGAAGSWQMSNRWATMARGEYEFGFAVDWMRKDLGITLSEADHNGATLTLTQIVDTYYAEIQAMGGDRWDTSSLLARLTKP